MTEKKRYQKIYFKYECKHGSMYKVYTGRERGNWIRKKKFFIQINHVFMIVKFQSNLFIYLLCFWSHLHTISKSCFIFVVRVFLSSLAPLLPGDLFIRFDSIPAVNKNFHLQFSKLGCDHGLDSTKNKGSTDEEVSRYSWLISGHPVSRV